MDEQVARHWPIDRRIAEIAARQHGVVTRRQLLSIGVTAAGIDKRLRRGALHAVHRGVYAVRHPALTRQGDYMAAVLALGSGAALSHVAAAALWGLRAERGPRIDVTVPTAGGRKRRRVIVVHRAVISPDEVTVLDGIQVTTPTRTLIDLADVLGQRQLERAFDQAIYLGLDVPDLTARRGRRGYGRLSRVLAGHLAGSTWTRSELEERMLALCRRADLPAPAVNTHLLGFEVDFSWEPQRLAVETDGWAGHRAPGPFERDRMRDAQLVEAGWRVVRFTRRRLATKPGEVAAQLARLLAA